MPYYSDYGRLSVMDDKTLLLTGGDLGMKHECICVTFLPIHRQKICYLYRILKNICFSVHELQTSRPIIHMAVGLLRKKVKKNMQDSRLNGYLQYFIAEIIKKY